MIDALPKSRLPLIQLRQVRLFIQCLLLASVGVGGMFLLFIVGEIASFVMPWWPYAILTVYSFLAMLGRRAIWKQLPRVLVCLPIGYFALILHAGTSRTEFLRDFYKIQPGMHESEVERIMAGYVEGSGFAPNPFDSKPEPTGQYTIPNTRIFRHSDEAAYDADWGQVTIIDGKVKDVRFLPD